MVDALPLDAKNPKLNQIAAVWSGGSGGNSIYGLMTADGGIAGKGPEAVQLVVAPLGGKPKFYCADTTEYNNGSGGMTIKTGLGPITVEDITSEAFLTQANGYDMRLNSGGQAMKQNLQRLLKGASGPSAQP